ncbi:MAG: Gfo/Idh/MocA family oxidoreductase, partial [Clostridia bacterium]|nr:Gfo/Idh/MocA family oxidoreductase [Clostridia bacterium]
MKKANVKVGLIGLGIRGRSLVKSILACPEAEIVAICDLYEDRIEKTKALIKERRNTEPAVFEDYKSLIADNNVEAVVIATSWDEHTRMAV